jgi:hypothetical protein
MANQSCSSSAAKMSLPIGVKDPGMQMIVEGGKRVSFEQIKRDVEYGVGYFNAKRPIQFRIH